MKQSRAALYCELSIGQHRIGIYAPHLHHVNYQSTPSRAAEIQQLLLHHHSRSGVPIPTLILGDLNQARSVDTHVENWPLVVAALQRFNAPEDDGVDSMLTSNGFTNCWDIKADRNFSGGGEGAPPLTHWTGTTVDHVYMQAPHFKLCGLHVLCSDFSDHLPVCCGYRSPQLERISGWCRL